MTRGAAPPCADTGLPVRSGQNGRVPADAVILLHGQPATSAVWLAVRHRLSGLPVLMPDRPGYGTNPEPATDFPGNVDWLRGVLDRSGVGRVVLAGHSWAGGVAVLAAARHPDRIAGVALVASVGPGCLRAHDRPLAWPVTGEVAAVVGLRMARLVYAYQMRRFLGAHVPSADLGYAHMEVAAQFRRPVWRSFLAEQRTLVRQLPMLDGALGEMRVPTTVLTGTRDSAIPRQCPERLARAIPGATLRRVAGAGHELPLQRPDEVATAIRSLAA